MIVNITIPSPGESISEVEIASWLVEDGAIVEKDQEVAEIESEKATLMLAATEAGKITIVAPAHTSVKVGSVACTIDTSANAEISATPANSTSSAPESIATTPKPAQEPAADLPSASSSLFEKVKITPVARKKMEEHHLSIEDVLNGLQRVSASDVEASLRASSSTPTVRVEAGDTPSRDENRTKMTQLRKKLAQRLVSVKNETAMLTTFNEVDMSAVMELRKKYQKEFVDKHGVKLGIMSFFTKAVVEALKQHPSVNSMIDGDDIVTPNFYDISVAVQTPKGLMVPVVRDAQSLSLAGIELKIQELADKGRNGKLSLDEMSGGTFTITNGGVFGSMMSTPIINPPQSGILGMHNIIERPVAINGKVEIRPMMYIALSYDHRIIDGKDSVGFLVKVKQMIENPMLLLFSGTSPDKKLLDL